MVNFDLENWVDHPKNPLIEPPWPSPLVGDPSVVLPGDSPDGNWHMFLNTVFGIYHYISDEGINWRKGKRIFSGWRALVFQENDFYYLFYEEYKTPFRSKIRVRTSGDLKCWSEPRTILEPSLDWEGRIYRTNGNPCLVKKGDIYMLYYSAGQVFLRDLGFTEPRYICLAQANEIFGPYEKLEKPILSPSDGDPYRNMGCGAIKVIYNSKDDSFIGFNNGIYRDEAGKSRSAILLVKSKDGIRWEDCYEEPIVRPTRGWKRALVYQLDVKKVNGELWMYYNARDGWMRGKERIGLAICKGN